MSPKLVELAVGTVLPTQVFRLRRADLVQYAGASGDFNPIHWSEEAAVGVGLPNVIAHGMLTMAVTARVVTDWIGDPGAVLDYSVRFTRPVVVPLGEDTEIEVSGSVRSLDSEAGTAVVDLVARVAGETILSKARVIARLAS